MAFNVDFYTNFIKRRNSSKRPDETGGIVYQTASCVLKDNTDAYAPTLVIDEQALGGLDIHQCNYVHIKKFGKYYYIDALRYVLGVWEADCREDVLSTFRTSYANDTMYIERTNAPNYINPKLIDGYYPADNDITFKSDATRLPITADGTYIVGVIGGGAILSKVGAVVCYYAMTYSQLMALTDYLFKTSNYSEIGTDEIVQTFFNPIQYIVSCKWVPFNIGDSAVNKVRFGWWSAANVSAKLIERQTYRFTLAKRLTISHPYRDDLSDYRNCAAYAKYKLYIPYAGEYEIPTEMVQKYETLGVEIEIDPVSGDMIGEVRAGNGQFEWANGKHVIFFQSNASCDITLAQGAIDYARVIGSGIEAIGNLFTLNMSGAIGNVYDGIQASQATISKLGGNGSRALGEINPYVTLYSIYRVISSIGTNSLGRPCGRRVKLSNLMGYYLKVAKSEASISGTTWEMEEINTFLEGGVWLE